MAEPFWKEPQSLWVELKELFGGFTFQKTYNKNILYTMNYKP